MNQKLNLGCGPQVVDGWVNVDYALGAKLAKLPVVGPLSRSVGLFNVKWDPRIYLHDLTKPFPWGAGSVDACYSSHTVEHLSRDHGARFIAEAFRVLKSGGVLRIVVPDLAPLVTRYTLGKLPADRFVEELGVLYGSDKKGLKKLLAPLMEFPHKCMYDTSTMLRAMNDAGFVSSVRAPFDSEISDIRLVELEDRTRDAVIVEGRKP